MPSRETQRHELRPAGSCASLLDPWDRQPGESDEAWVAWQTYRDQELPRSIRRAARGHGKGIASYAKHSARWGWPARAATWDNYRAAAQLQATIEERKRAGKRHAQIAFGQLTVSARFAGEVLRRLAADPRALERLPLSELLRAHAALMRATPPIAQLERLALGVTAGEPEATEGLHDDVSRKTDAELDAFLAGIDAAQLREAEGG